MCSCRNYFVSPQKAVQYFVKKPQPDSEATASEDRTIVGKQWISKDILETSSYQFKEYGGGRYVIMTKLTPGRTLRLHRARTSADRRAG